MASSTSALLRSLDIRASARREVEQHLKPSDSSGMLLPKRAKAEKLNGWHVGRSHSLYASKSEPVLAFRNKHPADAVPSSKAAPPPSINDQAAPSKASPPRGESSSPRPPLHSPKPKPDASDASGAPLYSRAPKDARGGGRQYLRSNDRQSAVFLSPQRSTSVKRSGAEYDCVAPGYYDSSVTSGHWTMAGSIQRPDKLSPTFLAPGRMLPPIETSSSSKSVGDGWDEGGHAPPAQPAAGAHGISRGEKHKLARKQRDIQKLQARLQNEATRRAKGTHTVDFRSPATIQRHEASFEQRLATATTVPNTDRAIAQLVARGGDSGFHDEVGTDTMAGLTTSGPHVYGSLSLSSGAFANGG